MRRFLMRLCVKARLFREDKGQDLIEYALVVAIIALAATAGMTTVATDVNAAFGSIGTMITQYS